MHADIPTEKFIAAMRRLKTALMMAQLLTTSIECRYETPELTSMTTSKRRHKKQRDTKPKAKPKKAKKLGRRDHRRRR